MTAEHAVPPAPHPPHASLPPEMVAMQRHPLEVFPWFRRWPQSLGRDLFYTFIFNLLFAAGFALVGFVFTGRIDLRRVLEVNVVVAQCIGFSIHGLYIVADWLFSASRRVGLLVRTVYFLVVPVLGVLLGYWLATTLLEQPLLRARIFTVGGMLSVASVACVIMLVLLAIFIPRERAARAQVQAFRDEARAVAAEREATLARMQLLIAQVEPHFLYNTLAHVVSLVDTEPAVAKRMLDRLIVLLRATASAAGGTSTLGAQVELLRAYLELIALRMGARLAWAIDVPGDLAGLAVPPMLLQPVVENAIKHGLEPKIDGGRIDIAAHREGDRLVLVVTDSGLGIRATRDPASTGLGLPNLRARLAALYGAAGSLAIADHAPTGTRVVITIPIGHGH
jgi:hypothetical protein